MTDHKPPHAVTPQSGFSMLYVILALVGMATLATSLATMTRTGVETQLNENAIAQARYMALAGYNYVRQFKEDYIELDGKTFSFGNAGEFEISSIRDDPRMDTLMEAHVIGRVNQGTSREANYVIHKLFNAEDPKAITFRDDFEDFKVQTSDPDKQPVVKNPDKTFTIGNNQNYAFGSMLYHGDKSLNWGQNICNFEPDPTGGGDSDVPDVDAEGNDVPWGCDFKDGFRMFFVSTYYTNNADGIVFTFFATNSTAGSELNPYYPPDDSGNPTKEVCSSGVCGESIKVFTSVGGESQHGEMIGYAGDGRIYDSSNGSNSCSSSANHDVKYWLDPEQNGIQPPKVGVEFDNYPNTGSGAICQDGTDCPAHTSQRRDTSGDHIAFVYWGQNTDFDCVIYHEQDGDGNWVLYEDYAGNTSSAVGSMTYDDNRHGEGTSGTPTSNPVNQITGDRGYWPNSVAGTTSDFNWQNNPFAFRLEVERDIDTGEYILNGWIRRCSDTDTSNGPCREYFDRTYQSDHGTAEDKLFFSDTSRFLCGAGDEASGSCTANNIPDIQQSFTLPTGDGSLHEQFEKIIFGFTEATGGAVQTATYSEFILQFVKPNDYNTSGEKRRVIDKTIN